MIDAEIFWVGNISETISPTKIGHSLANGVPSAFCMKATYVNTIVAPIMTFATAVHTAT